MDTRIRFHWVLLEATLNFTFLRKRKAKAPGLYGSIYIVRIWEKGINSMKNKNPVTIKPKSVNKAKAGGRSKRKGLD